MPIKYFCDVCGEETKRNYVTERLKPELVHDSGKVVCDVMVAINGTTNGGVICEECLRYALTQPEIEKLTEEEKRRVKYLYAAGWSSQEITQDTLDRRNDQPFQAILKEVGKWCVRKLKEVVYVIQRKEKEK